MRSSKDFDRDSIRAFNQKKHRTLFFITLYYGNDNVLLSHTEYWVAEFAKHFDEVRVFAVHEGTHEDPPKNVLVRKLGGGSFKARAQALTILIITSLKIFFRKGEPVVFYHMFPSPAVILGPILKLKKITQILWYSHSATSLLLKIATRWVDYVVTPTTHSFPIPSKKVRVVGHGIPVLFDSQRQMSILAHRKDDILYVGRISPIKNIEIIIEAIDRSKTSSRKLLLVGPVLSMEYKEKIESLSASKGIELAFLDSVPFISVGDVMSNHSMFFSGNPKTLDKATVLAAICGCFVLTAEKEVAQAIGMAELWKSLGFLSLPSIDQQIDTLNSLEAWKIVELRENLKRYSYNQNRLDETVKRIIQLTNKSY